MAEPERNKEAYGLRAHTPSTSIGAISDPEDTYEESERGSRDNTELKQDLEEKHVNMITFAACIGVGLFLQSGQIVYLAGPGLAVIAYLLAGSIIWATMGSLGEMSALFPMSGGIFIFPERFLDRSVGYAVGWLTWFSWTVIIASVILAVAQLFDFQYKPEYLEMVGYPDSTLQWSFGQTTYPSVWVGICLVCVFLPNCLPIRYYGRLEYLFGCIKIVFIVGLIILNVILNALQRVKHTHGRFWTYDGDYSFATHNVTLGTLPDGTEQYLSGSSGIFLGMWSAMTTVVYSMIGFETISVTAGENKDLKTAETIKIATRKISLRIITLYALCCFCVGLNVPYTDEYLKDLVVNAVRNGQNSIFILALVRNHVRVWPHLFNGFFIFSALTSGMNSLYLSSRILHALAKCDSVWPQYDLVVKFQKNLARTIGGVPYCAVFVSWLFGFLAFLAAQRNTPVVLGRLVTNSIVSMFIVYATICVSYLRFHRAIRNAANGEDLVVEYGSDFTAYDREHPKYPYKSHFQRGRALYGFVGCVMIVLLNGWRTFVPPFNSGDFIASYISIPIFLLLIVLYYIKLQRWDPRQWRIKASRELRQPRPLVVENKQRRGILRFDEEGFTKNNLKKFFAWVWVWLK